MGQPTSDPTAPADSDRGPAGAPCRVVVVGSGPAGVYTCESLLSWSDAGGRPVEIDLVERLPMPFGLLRYGVAPDHPRIKSVARVLRAVLDDPRVRFVGGVEVGANGVGTHAVGVDELRERADAVVICTGALADRELGIPGEDLTGSFGAAEFVTWYDGHPDAEVEHALTAERVAVVGVGNVALDVARMLVRPTAELEATDIPEAVRTALAAGACRCVTVLGRRGVENARFTPMELRELDTVAGLQVVVDPADLELDDAAQAVVDGDRHVAKVVDRLRQWADLQVAAGHAGPDDAERAALDAGRRVLRFRFHRAPVEILGSGGEVVGLRVERTSTGEGGRVTGTGETEDLEVGAVYRAVGYRSTPIPGLPFDERRAVIPSTDGRVVDDAGEPIPGVYVAGWVRRGPTGVIGTNRSCAAGTVESLVADLAAGRTGHRDDHGTLRELLDERGVTVVDDEGWRRIDAAELALGAAAGRERTKIVDRAEMLRLAAGAARD